MSPKFGQEICDGFELSTEFDCASLTTESIVYHATEGLSIQAKFDGSVVILPIRQDLWGKRGA